MACSLLSGLTAFLAKNLVGALRASELIVPLLRPSGAQGGPLGFVSSGRLAEAFHMSFRTEARVRVARGLGLAARVQLA